MDISKYKIINIPLGCGKYGNVFLARLNNDIKEEYVAIKIINKKEVMDMEFQVRQEVKILKLLSHPNIIKSMNDFEDDRNIYILLEYCPGGDLYKQIEQEPLSDRISSNYIRQLVSAVKYIHSKNIIHRDIKPDNILLTDNGIKLADFGWAIVTKKKQSLICGTLDYLAPEIIIDELYDNRIDIWYIGVTAYELLSRKVPFMHLDFNTVDKNSFSRDIIYHPEFSENAKDFLSKILVKNPDYRMTLDQMESHSWLKQESH